ncbi:MAG: hypothetical protein ACRCX8_16245 [Sarcina sp.]
MKKLALISILVLAIGASVTAGTMAKYSQTLEEQTSDVEAKKFVLTQEKKIDDIKLAPGETYKTDFSVNTSDTEVDMKLNFTAKMGLNNKNGEDEKFDKALIQNGCLELYKIDEQGNKISDNLINFDRKGSFLHQHGIYGEGKGSNDVMVDGHGIQNYRLELKWNANGGSDKEQTEIMENSITTGVRLGISGEQIIK